MREDLSALRESVRDRAARCRTCGYRFPEQSSPKPAGLAMGAGFPLFVTGVLILFVPATSRPR